jgi:hypothetical protein
MQETIKALILEAERSLILAAAREAQDGFDLEDTLERREAAGFLDGIRHAAMFFGHEVSARDSDFLTELAHDLHKPCTHNRYTETALPVTEPAEDGGNPWTVIVCDNCTATKRRERSL